MGIILVGASRSISRFIRINPPEKFSEYSVLERERERANDIGYNCVEETYYILYGKLWVQSGYSNYVYNLILFLFMRNASQFPDREWKYQETKQKVRRRQEEFIY